MSQFNTPPSLEGILSGLRARIKALETRQPKVYAEALSEVVVPFSGGGTVNGPSVRLTVPAGAFVVIFAQADIQTGSGGQTIESLSEASGDIPTTQILANTFSPSGYVTKGTAPNSSNGVALPLSGPLMFPATPGTRTYTLVASSLSTSGLTTVRNCKMWAYTL